MEEAAHLMRSHHVGNLVVVEKTGPRNRPVGIVTDRDIVVEVVAAGVSAATLTVGDIMGEALAGTVSRQQKCEAAARS